MAQSQKLARMFKALSVDTRVQIVMLLRGRALCVNVLAARLNVSAAAVSQHLRVLRGADLVIPEKRGYCVHYRLNEEMLAKWKHAAGRLLEAKRSKKKKDE